MGEGEEPHTQMERLTDADLQFVPSPPPDTCITCIVMETRQHIRSHICSDFPK